MHFCTYRLCNLHSGIECLNNLILRIRSKPLEILDPYRNSCEIKTNNKSVARLGKVRESWRRSEKVGEGSRKCEVGAGWRRLERVGESLRKLETVGGAVGSSWRRLRTSEKVGEGWRQLEKVGGGWRKFGKM